MLIYLCEDSNSDFLRLQHHLSAYAREHNLAFEIVSFFSGKALLAAYKEAEKKPALIFLDIYMDGINGIDTARTLRRMGCTAGILFTTSSTEHAMDSYEVNALYYLQKPYDRIDFNRAMARCQPILDSERDFFVFHQKKQTFSVPYGDIIFFETGNQSHSIIMHTTSDTFLFSGALSKIAQTLEPSKMFLSVGRSFLVNLNHVKGKQQNDLVMSDESMIQIPLRKQEKIFADLSAWENAKR